MPGDELSLHLAGGGESRVQFWFSVCWFPVHPAPWSCAWPCQAYRRIKGTEFRGHWPDPPPPFAEEERADLITDV